MLGTPAATRLAIPGCPVLRPQALSLTSLSLSPEASYFTPDRLFSQLPQRFRDSGQGAQTSFWVA